MMRFLRPCLPPVSAWATELEASYATRWFSNGGPAAKRLEAAVPRHFGIPRSAALCASATAGLTAALQALGVSGRVAVPAFTFPASVQAILAAGCEPVLLDVSETHWELSPEHVAGVADLDAVLAVRSFGMARDLSALEAVCRARGLPLVIDAAAALGGRLPGGAAIGAQGDVEVFSLHATKVFAVGEGGLLTAPESLMPAIRRSLNFGLEAGVPVARGGNGKLSEFAAACGLAMLRQIDAHLARRQTLAKRYAALLQAVPGVGLPRDAGGAPWQAYPVRLPPAWSADAVLAAAAEAGVELRRYYVPALHEAPAFRHASVGRLPVSEALARQMICLPLYSDMSDAEFDRVVRALAHAGLVRQASA